LLALADVDAEDEEALGGGVAPVGVGTLLEDEGMLLCGGVLSVLDVDDDWHPANTAAPIKATNSGCFSLRA
jgi:hypothetical protein